MIRIGRAPNIAIAALWVDMLRQLGMSASLQRFFLGSVAGELPPEQCWPEIWVDDDGQAERATQLLAELQQTAQRRWICGCGETVEGGFDACWSCGRTLPA